MGKKIDIIKTFLEHPDKEELIAKLASGISPADIHEGLAARYETVDERKFILSEKTISLFYKDYFDFYALIRNDAQQLAKPSPEQEMSATLASNPTYQTALQAYTNSEVDVRLIAKRMVAAIETRAAQVFDQIAEDPRNTKMDRTMIEWFNTLTSLCEKFDNIQIGPVENVNIQNNINIQIVDQHINVIYNIIKEILTKLDYDTSMIFIDMFNDAMQELKKKEPQVLPVDTRLNEVKLLDTSITAKLDNK